MTDIFGDIVSTHTVELAVRDNLKLWFATYLQEMELQLNLTRGQLPSPRSYALTTELEKFPEEQLPAIMIVSPGLDHSPSVFGDGMYIAPFAVAVAVIVSGRDELVTNKLQKIYAAVIRAIMVQKPSQGGTARTTDWVDESYDDLPREAARTMKIAVVGFVVEVEDVVNRRKGPVNPNPETEPGTGPWTILDVELDLTKESVIS